MEVQVEVTQTQAKEAEEPREAGRGRKDPPAPRGAQDSSHTTILVFGL